MAKDRAPGRCYAGSMLDPRLLEILCCPACKGDLSAVPEGLRCQACGLEYPIEDGIPVMLVDRAVRR